MAANYFRLFWLLVAAVVGMAAYAAAEEIVGTRPIGWNDICTSWDEPRNTGREKAIDQALDDYEENRVMRNNPFSHPEYPRLSQSWGKQLNEYKEAPSASEEKIEEWLKNDHPYFYKEHMEGKNKDELYYGDEDLDREDSRLAAILKNINYGAIVQSQAKPVYYFETVFPIFQSEKKRHTFFSHDRISVVSGQDGSFSAGLGYRYYEDQAPYIIGANTFYDFQQNGDHYRMGYGGEFIGEDIEARFNFYDGLSPKRKTGIEFEQAVDGFDVEIGAVVPKFHLAKIYGGYQWYDYNHDDDRQGWKTRLELTPAPSLRLNLEAIDENEADISYRFDGRFNFNFTTFDPEDIMADIKGESLEPTRISLEDRLLERVEREFIIRTERWKSTALEDLIDVFVTVQFPGLQCGSCLDNVIVNGMIDPGEGFEVNIKLTNLGDLALTNIFVDNETVSNLALFANSNTEEVILPDAAPGATVSTDQLTDLDIVIHPSAVAGDSTLVSFDLHVNGEVFSFTFGPFVVGEVAHGQQYN